MNRRCASLTKEQFKKVGESDPFYCWHCITPRQNSQIDELKKLVSELSAKIGYLKAQPPLVSNGHSCQTEPTSVDKLTSTAN